MCVFQLLIEYNQQEEDINKLKAYIQSVCEQSEAKLQEIHTNRQIWLTPINELVKVVDASFGKYFQTMNCVGEIVLHIPEDEVGDASKDVAIGRQLHF